MVNSIEKQTIVNGPKNLVVKAHIDGDGSGEETDTILINVSDYAATEVSIIGIHTTLSGFTADLIWDATANVACINIPDYEYNLNGDIKHFGGLPNNAGAGKTGDILITTIGLGASEHGTIILEMKKK